jgi:hypothetical protein
MQRETARPRAERVPEDGLPPSPERPTGTSTILDVPRLLSARAYGLAGTSVLDVVDLHVLSAVAASTARIAATTSSGASSCTKWPAPAIVRCGCPSAPGISRCIGR